VEVEIEDKLAIIGIFEVGADHITSDGLVCFTDHLEVFSGDS